MGLFEVLAMSKKFTGLDNEALFFVFTLVIQIAIEMTYIW
jgi:hypothetical protein